MYLAKDVGQPLAAGVLALYRLVGDAVSNDVEDSGQVGVVQPEDDGVVSEFRADGGQVNDLPTRS